MCIFCDFQTNEINQGDSLEHDFGCSVQTLIFPVIQDLHELPQVKLISGTVKPVNKGHPRERQHMGIIDK